MKQMWGFFFLLRSRGCQLSHCFPNLALFWHVWLVPITASHLHTFLWQAEREAAILISVAAQEQYCSCNVDSNGCRLLFSHWGKNILLHLLEWCLRHAQRGFRTCGSVQYLQTALSAMKAETSHFFPIWNGGWVLTYLELPHLDAKSGS